jgi:hypothetical protein
MTATKAMMVAMMAMMAMHGSSLGVLELGIYGVLT